MKCSKAATELNIFACMMAAVVVVVLSATIALKGRQPQLANIPARMDISRKGGIAVAPIIDTSASMDRSVTEVDGHSTPKIQIAKRCALNLIQRVETYASERQDRPVALAI